MQTFKLRVTERQAHDFIAVFAGPDVGHLAYCGGLCMSKVESEEFLSVLNGGVAFNLLNGKDTPSLIVAKGERDGD